MKCTICEEEIKVGEVIHEVPNRYNDMIYMCSDCYTSIYRQWRVK